MTVSVLIDSAYDPQALERQHPQPGPGLLATGKYLAVEGEPPFVRISEYESSEALRGALERHRTNLSDSQDSQELIPGIPMVQRRIFNSRNEDFGASREALASSRFLVASTMSVRADHEDDLNAWYLEEHIPALLKIDGWLRSRRFEKVAGPGPLHLALHDLRDLEMRKEPAFHKIMTTPWRLRLVEVRTAFDRSLLKIDDGTST